MNLQSRITNIITKPKEEWPVIAAEQTNVAALFQSYIMILAAIPAVANFIGQTVIGVSVPFVGNLRVGVGSGLVTAVVTYALTLVSCYLSAFVIEKLAPSFGSKGDTTQALKLVAYAYTPAWIAGVLGIIPVLGLLVVLASLYSIYLFYLGLPVLMQTPADKVIPYMLVSALVIIVLSLIVGAITTMVAAPAILPRL
jgi:Yip1 domain